MKNKMTKKNLKIERNDSWVYIILLSTLSIFIYSIKKYTFTIINFELNYSIIFIPLIFFLVNYILKKYNPQQALSAIIISVLVQLFFMIAIPFALNKQINHYVIFSNTASLILSEIVDLMIYDFLENNTEKPYILVLLTYLFSIVLYYLIYTLVSLNIAVADDYWIRYFTTITISFVISIPITYIDLMIKRGD